MKAVNDQLWAMRSNMLQASDRVQNGDLKGLEQELQTIMNRIAIIRLVVKQQEPGGDEN